ncbi:MAG: esterase family protein, partial [Ignavibacteria bacterium]
RDFEMLVFGESGYPVLLFPTSMGRFNENKDFGLIDSVSDFVNSGRITIFCPDGIDSQSWYNKSIHPVDRVKTHLAYENVLLYDVIPFAAKRSGINKVGVAGCSFGGYHALNLAFRHPDKIGYLLNMSGAFNIKQFLNGYYDDNCYFNNPPDYMPNLNDENILNEIRKMGIVLGTGEHDACKDDNFNMSDILNNKKINHWLDFHPGEGHDWPFWKSWFPKYLEQIKPE